MPVGTLDGGLDEIWSGNGGAATSGLVPDPFMVSINGRTYLHDLEFKPWKRQAFRATTDSITRNQSDTSNEPGEQSLSTESLWRRTQDSWHLGAGQEFVDRKGSEEYSFRRSKGVNPWTEWQLTLLNDTTLSLSSANGNLDLVVCGPYLYVIDGQHLKFTTNLSSWTTVIDTPAVTPSSLCSDGSTVWVAYGASGVYSTAGGTSTASQYISSSIAGNAVIRFVMGRLMLGTGNVIYNLTASGTLPVALGTSLYGNLVWNDFTDGNGVIFACGNSGDVGVIYSIQLTADGTALSAPIVAGQLPNGENVNCIQGYGGSGVAIGSTLGWRWAEQQLANEFTGTVALTLGPINTVVNGFDAPVTAMSPYGRWIWGTYADYDTLSTGLFRMDLTQFVADLAPAWATDLMASTQGTVNSVKHFNGTPVFSVTGVGVYSQASTYVPSGTLDSGWITYGIADDKMPVYVDVVVQNAGGSSLQCFASINNGPFTSMGTYTGSSTFFEFSTPQSLNQTFEIRQELFSGSSNTTTPTLTRHTLRSVPATVAPTDWSVVIQLREVVRIKDVEYYLVPSAEYEFLDTLRTTKAICTLQVGNISPQTVTIETIDWIPEEWDGLTGEFNGVAVLTCRTVV
jgi:hypothetical protein